MVEKDEAQYQEALHPEETLIAKEPSMDGDEADDMESFQELYESSMVNIVEGEVIHGKIIQITDDYVMVDIGYKSEGQIRLDEFMMRTALSRRRSAMRSMPCWNTVKTTMGPSSFPKIKP